MEAFWPGPISFILPLKSGYLCETVTGIEFHCCSYA